MRKEAKTHIMAALGWGVLLGALAVPGSGRAQDGKAGCGDCVRQDGATLLSRIPYLNRLFKNTGVAACPPCCEVDPKCGEDEFVERIGVDFDFAFSPEAAFGIQVVEFCPAPATCGRTTSNASQANTACFACEDETCCDDIDVDCLAGGNEELQQRLLSLSVQAAVLGNMAELQSELVEARLEMSEKLAAAKVEHFEALLELAVENAQLKTKLEFQAEREKLQAQVAQLAMENSGLKTQMAFHEQILGAQLAALSIQQEAEQLAKEKERLETRVAELEEKARKSDASTTEESVANKRRGGTSTR